MDQNLHVIHSKKGLLGKGVSTGRSDIAAMVAALKADKRKHLVLHFHGGLVPEQDGFEVARQLHQTYSPSADKGGYPIFFVWESGFLETMRDSLGDLVREAAFAALRDKLLGHLQRKLGIAAFDKSLAGTEAMLEVDSALATMPEAERHALADLALPQIDAAELEAELEADPQLRFILAGLPHAPDGLAGPEKNMPDRRENWVAEALAREFLAERESGPEKAHDGWFWTLVEVAWFLAKLARAVLLRMRSGRDHGLYATCVEELMRALKLGGQGINEWGKKLQWDQMKETVENAFGDGPECAGTALLRELAAAMQDGESKLELERITLVGHSTGAIYIRHWLAHSAVLGRIKQDVVFLAPAITHLEFAALLDTQGERIGSFRLFGMRDEHERKDQLWGQDNGELGKLGDQDWRRFLYPASLLYLVSGLLESQVGKGGVRVDAPDMPLLGLHRYLENRQVYPASAFPSVEKVRVWLGEPGRHVVWSKAVDGKPGFQCDTVDHGAFDDDTLMLDSLRHIVTVGF